MMSRTVRRVLAIVLLIASASVWGGPMLGLTIPAGATVALTLLVSAIAAVFVFDEFNSHHTGQT